MKYAVKSSSLVLLFLSFAVIGKQSGRQEKVQVVAMPRQVILSVVAHQPECPLEFLEVSVYGAIGGGGLPQYKVRNRSNKPIAEIDLATKALGGGETVRKFKAKDPGEWVMPGQAWPQAGPETDKHFLVETVPATDRIREQQMKGIVIFMVVRVKFVNGSTYSDEKVYNELRSFSEGIDLPRR